VAENPTYRVDRIFVPRTGSAALMQETWLNAWAAEGYHLERLIDETVPGGWLYEGVFTRTPLLEEQGAVEPSLHGESLDAMEAQLDEAWARAVQAKDHLQGNGEPRAIWWQGDTFRIVQRGGLFTLPQVESLNGGNWMSADLDGTYNAHAQRRLGVELLASHGVPRAVLDALVAAATEPHAAPQGFDGNRLKLDAQAETDRWGEW
jgi:hypothetical protein